MKIEVTDQLKDHLKQIGEIAGDVKEIKGKLEVLDPLIRELAIKRISEVGNLNSKELVARLPELRHLATIAKTEGVTVKPEAIEKVGKTLVQAGDADAWSIALDFLNYKSFLNTSLSLNVANIQATGTYTTHYRTNFITSLGSPQYAAAGMVSREQAAQLLPIGEADPNASYPVGNDWILVTGGSLILDNMHMKKVILHNVRVFYNGGPLEMQGVYFLNCIFDVKQKSNGEHLVAALLDPSPAITTFKAS